MKYFLLITAVLFSLVCGSVARAADDKPVVEAVTAKDQESKPTDTFVTDTPKIYAFFKTKGTKTGDKLRSVWVAEDVGTAAPKETKIDEVTVTGDKEDFVGAFSLSKPDKGWPVGKYRVDIYAGESIVTTVKFTVEAAEAKDK